jgi:hypothetical protein
MKRQLRVRLALVVGELDFIGAIEKLHDGAHLAARRPSAGASVRSATTSSNCGVVFIACRLSFTKQLVKRGARWMLASHRSSNQR